MVVKDTREKTTFAEIKTGECFIAAHKVYIKAQIHNLNRDAWEYYGVNLTTGSAVEYADECAVERAPGAEVVIK